MPTVQARFSALRTLEPFRVPRGLELKLNDMVVLRSRRGVELGQVKSDPSEEPVGPSEVIAGEILRKASHEDSAKAREIRFSDYRPMLRICRDLARTHRLEMRFAAAEWLLERDRLVIYFTAEERVDFRELVKDVSRQLDARIDLRQVGARDAAKLTGDVGVCGIELCCSSYLVDFIPVSMKMAKNQRISLDPMKISGMCGRLKCCLKYEDDLYARLRKTVPLEGQPCKCDGHDCIACGVDVLGQKVTVAMPDGKRELREVSEIEFESGWTEKDIRRFRKEAREKQQEEIARRRAAGDRRAQRRAGETDRRQADAQSHPMRREGDAGSDAPGVTAETEAQTGEVAPSEEKGRRKRRRRRTGKQNKTPGAAGGATGDASDDSAHSAASAATTGEPGDENGPEGEKSGRGPRRSRRGGRRRRGRPGPGRSAEGGSEGGPSSTPA